LGRWRKKGRSRDQRGCSPVQAGHLGFGQLASAGETVEVMMGSRLGDEEGDGVLVLREEVEVGDHHSANIALTGFVPIDEPMSGKAAHVIRWSTVPDAVRAEQMSLRGMPDISFE